MMSPHIAHYIWAYLGQRDKPRIGLVTNLKLMENTRTISKIENEENIVVCDAVIEGSSSSIGRIAQETLTLI